MPENKDRPIFAWIGIVAGIISIGSWQLYGYGASKWMMETAEGKSGNNRLIWGFHVDTWHSSSLLLLSLAGLFFVLALCKSGNTRAKFYLLSVILVGACLQRAQDGKAVGDAGDLRK